MASGLSRSERAFFAMANRQRQTRQRVQNYRANHPRVVRRLHGTGMGSARVERLLNPTNQMQSMRVNRAAAMNGGAHAGVANHGLAGRTFRVVRTGGARHASTGRSSG